MKSEGENEGVIISFNYCLKESDISIDILLWLEKFDKNGMYGCNGISMEKVDIKSKNAVTYCEINWINEVQNTDFDIMNLCMNHCNNCFIEIEGYFWHETGTA